MNSPTHPRLSSPAWQRRRYLLTRAGVFAFTLLTMLNGCSYGYQRAYRGETVPVAKFAQRPALPVPAADPMQAERIALGRALFNDRRLSADNSLACADCHRPDKGFADGRRRAIGIHGQIGTRHTPQLWNIAFAPRFFADGRAPSLEAQALMPITNAAEMGRTASNLLDPIRADAGYRRRFARAFPVSPAITSAMVAGALAAYERTLVSGTAPFDRWAAGDAGAISPAAARGFSLFAGKARCAECHSGWTFSDGKFHDIGLPDGDKGRAAVTGRKADSHAFRTLSLREIGCSAPYMHDGSLPNLAAVVDHYASGVVARARTPLRVALTISERRDLVAFLASLDSEKSAGCAPAVPALP